MIDNEARISKLKEKDYQRLFGVTKTVFEQMRKILEEASAANHRRGGRPLKLSVLDKLVIMLGYYREYRPMENIAFDYQVSKSTISESITWVENTLVKSNQLSLPSKRALLDDPDIHVILVDVTECEIERPKKSRKDTTPEKRKSIH